MATPPRSGVAIAADNIREAVANLRLSMPDDAAADVLAELARSAFNVPAVSQELPASRGGKASNSGGTQGQSETKPDKPSRQRSLDKQIRQLEARLDRLNIAKDLEKASNGETNQTDRTPSSPVSADEHHELDPVPEHEHQEQPSAPPPPPQPTNSSQLVEPSSATKRSTTDSPESPLCTPTRLPADKKRIRMPPGLYHSTALQLGMTDTQPPPTTTDSSIGLEARLFAKAAIHSSKWAHLEQSGYISTYERGLHVLTMTLKGEKREDWRQIMREHCDKVLERQSALDGLEGVEAGGFGVLA